MVSKGCGYWVFLVLFRCVLFVCSLLSLLSSCFVIFFSLFRVLYLFCVCIFGVLCFMYLFRFVCCLYSLWYRMWGEGVNVSIWGVGVENIFFLKFFGLFFFFSGGRVNSFCVLGVGFLCLFWVVLVWVGVGCEVMGVVGGEMILFKFLVLFFIVFFVWVGVFVFVLE